MKKILFSIMIVILSAILAICASAATYKKGDANMDGKVNASDARKVLRVSAMLDNFTDAQIRICDMNNDGKIRAADARKVLRVAAKLDKDTDSVTIDGSSDDSSSKTELSGSIGTSFSSFMKTYGNLKKLDTNNNTVAYGNNSVTVSSDPKIINEEKISSIKITGGKYTLCGVSAGMSYSDALSTLKNAKWVSSKETKSQAVLTKNGMKITLSISDKTVKSVEYSFASSINQTETTKPVAKPEATTKPEAPTKPEETTKPITNEAYKKLPDQAKAFINGEFGLKGYMYNQEQKDKVSLFCSKNAIKIGMPMEMSEDSVTELEFLVADINTVPKIYLINKENSVCMKMDSDMFESISGTTTDEIFATVTSSGLVDINNLKITQRTEKENNITYTVYKISAVNECIEFYMIGDNIKRIYTYDSAGNLATRIDVDVFYENVPASEFSINQYTVIDFGAL